MATLQGCLPRGKLFLGPLVAVAKKNIPDFGLENNVVFSTDYPHLDVKYPRAVESFLKLPLPMRSRENISVIIARGCIISNLAA
ncbi:MAG TPA: hypothetical protein VGR30_11775 [Candidatus Binatia bacterium]|jgi:predicted TIM-barrel fold metal-dependent hydrolase|nr:hypothetical protein [Candidatus Binatia bacterium]